MKSTFEKMGGTYTLGADGIYYPNLVSTDEEPHYGKYGMMRRRRWVIRKNAKIGCYDYVGDKIPLSLWEKIMDRQETVCCAWEKTAFEEGRKVGIRLMSEVYGA